MLTVGVVGSSRKENEHRLPIHPDHFDLIAADVAANVSFEEGYGEPFAVSDRDIAGRFRDVRSRERILSDSDVVLLPKPLARDLEELREGATLWGWPHCVQQREITQAAIDRRLTLLAWEAMFTWKRGVREMHLFDRNNEMAGYCAVLHALELTGRDGFYGPAGRATVLSHGSVSRGAIHALVGRGYRDVTVFTQRPTWAVHDKLPGCRYARMVREGDGVVAVGEDGSRRPLIEELAGSEIIVNGILQDTDHPLTFVRESEVGKLVPGAVIVDVSCDLGMGFDFARPTSFEAPAFDVGKVTYYAVDHTPSYLWRSATWELSRVVVALLPEVASGPRAWEANETLRRAIEIREGRILNPKILAFQHRAEEYPHAPDPTGCGK